MDELERLSIIKSAQINQALGVFIFIFGIIITFAMSYTETFVQQMTDLVAGLVLITIGGGMIWKSKRTIRKFKKTNDK
ncbi:manganese efflux pump [Kriegella aquimaris]|uniref:Putative manganese efflux pump n=1 Tax=Kriegella aquimaris TaxID=192904 RepID=A0A1G9N7D6_9FLAO|nr:manganese efflux pump [Kriegella aquimaris]SDL81775.1 Putative manganese efflux pump [Kriegella aquimaris]